MRIVICGINFAPEQAGIGPYTTEYARILTAAGESVTVLTGYPHYPSWQRQIPPPTPDDFRLTRLWHTVPRRPTALRRLLYEVTFALSVTGALLRLPRADVAIGVVPSLLSSFALSAWCRLHRTPLVIVVQDLVSSSMVQTSTGGRAAHLVRRIERMLFRNARSVVVVSDVMTPVIVHSAGPSCDVLHIPNWPLGDPPSTEPPTDRAQLGLPADKFLVVHAGNIGKKQGLRTVVEAARIAASGSHPIHFVIAGDGNDREAIERSAAGLTNLTMLPALSHHLFGGLLSIANVLVLSQARTVTDMAFPSKLIAYSQAGRPIVAAVARESAVAAVLRRREAAVIVEPERPGALLQAVLSIYQEPELRRRLSAAARDYFEQELTPAPLRSEFIRAIRRASHGGTA